MIESREFFGLSRVSSQNGFVYSKTMDCPPRMTTTTSKMTTTIPAYANIARMSFNGQFGEMTTEEVAFQSNAIANMKVKTGFLKQPTLPLLYCKVDGVWIVETPMTSSPKQSGTLKARVALTTRRLNQLDGMKKELMRRRGE